jgi:hypothetical protein
MVGNDAASFLHGSVDHTSCRSVAADGARSDRLGPIRPENVKMVYDDFRSFAVYCALPFSMTHARPRLAFAELFCGGH